MMILVLVCSSIGLISAFPQNLFYSPTTPYGIKTAEYSGSGYGQGYNRQPFIRGHTTPFGIQPLDYSGAGFGQVGQSYKTSLQASAVPGASSVKAFYNEATTALKSVRNTLSQITTDPNKAATVYQILAHYDSSCGINSVKEGVTSIQKALGLLDRSRDDVMALVNSYDALITLKVMMIMMMIMML